MQLDTFLKMTNKNVLQHSGVISHQQAIKKAHREYEIDKATGAMFVDRFISTPMFYPCNYGFVPETLADDGDPALFCIF
jgi:inorganic pyrophosphatase